MILKAILDRFNYLAKDRLDLQFSTKEIFRSMSPPKVGDWAKLKRFARYLIRHLEMELVFSGYGDYDRIGVYVNSARAGCIRTTGS